MKRHSNCIEFACCCFFNLKKPPFNINNCINILFVFPLVFFNFFHRILCLRLNLAESSVYVDGKQQIIFGGM